MQIARVIPVLLLKNGGLYKPLKFKNDRYVGDPLNTIKIFNEKEANEILILDIEASMKNTPPNMELLKSLASECFMPVAYGGGIKDLRQVEEILSLGIEKVSFNAAFIDQPQLISEASKEFGSQSVVVSLDISKDFFGRPKAYRNRGSVAIPTPIHDLLKMTEDAGAGEILLASIDREGTKAGMDVELIRSVSAAVNVPVVASGGCGSLNDISKALAAGASAVGIGSFFVFYGKHDAVLVTYPSSEEIMKLSETR